MAIESVTLVSVILKRLCIGHNLGRKLDVNFKLYRFQLIPVLFVKTSMPFDPLYYVIF